MLDVLEELNHVMPDFKVSQSRSKGKKSVYLILEPKSFYK